MALAWRTQRFCVSQAKSDARGVLSVSVARRVLMRRYEDMIKSRPQPLRHNCGIRSKLYQLKVTGFKYPKCPTMNVICSDPQKRVFLSYLFVAF